MVPIFLQSLSAWLNPSHNNKSLWVWAHWRNCSTSKAQASPCTTPVLQGQGHVHIGSSVVDVSTVFGEIEYVVYKVG